VKIVNPRRVQCGSPACVREHTNTKHREYFRSKGGNPYRKPELERARIERLRAAGWVQPWTAARRESYQRRRAQKTATQVEAFQNVEVFERDRWRCGICGGKVSPARAWPDPLSASLDHVVPLSQGGAHTKANVRLAHLRCNISRGTRGGGEQLLLVG
jgi:5-methylcytosine-specific restriction endonuclease McrA